MSKENQFVYDSLLSENDICNYIDLKKDLIKNLKMGRKIILYGLRNTGKTSLIKAAVLPQLKKEGFLVIYADFFGVRNLSQLSERLQIALQQSLLDNFPVKTKFNDFLKSLKSIRPILKTDPIEGISLSLDFNSHRQFDLSELFKTMREIQKKVPLIFVFDEFQDIHYVEQAEALIRAEIQLLPKEMGFVFLGSKKHILSKLFARPKAPLAGMGEDREMPLITYEEYHDYILSRFSNYKISIDLATSTLLQDLLFRNPEAINIVCSQILRMFTGPYEITQDEVILAIQKTVELRKSRFEEYLSHFTPNEQKVLSVIAQVRTVQEPSGKEFVSKTKVSQKGVSKIVKKLEDEALIYKGEKGYFIGEALLANFLTKYRL